MKYDIFISYSRKDYDEVYALKQKLEEAIPELQCWFDIDGIESGEEFEDKIIKAINNSRHMLFALSENSIHSQWTKDEVMYAKNIGKKIIPVLLDGAQLTGWFLFKFGRIDCIDSTNNLQMDKLISNLAKWCDKTSVVVEKKNVSDKTYLAKVKQLLTQYKWIPLLVLSPLLFIDTTCAFIYFIVCMLYSFKCMKFKQFLKWALLITILSFLSIGFHEDEESNETMEQEITNTNNNNG